MSPAERAYTDYLFNNRRSLLTGEAGADQGRERAGPRPAAAQSPPESLGAQPQQPKLPAIPDLPFARFALPLRVRQDRLDDDGRHAEDRQGARVLHDARRSARREANKLMASEAYTKRDHPEHASAVEHVSHLFEHAYPDGN